MNTVIHTSSFSLFLLLLSGCIPISGAQGDAEQFVRQEQQKAETKAKGKIPNIRKMAPYEDYVFKIDLSDPFALKNFVEEMPAGGEPPVACEAGDCGVPPVAHTKGLLENYDINALRFVGVLKNDNAVALIETPDLGVLEAKAGDYIGRDNGRIIKIEEGSMVIQEKKKQGTQWRDQKKILVINK